LPRSHLRRPPRASPSVAASCSKNAKAHPGAQSRALRGHWAGAGPLKLEALQKQCAECADGPREPERCGLRDCPLWEYRTGDRPKSYRPRRTPLEALRAYCLLRCCGGQAEEVQTCWGADCPLWPWRMGGLDGEPRPKREANPRERPGKAAPREPKAPHVSDVQRKCIAAGQLVERVCPKCGEEFLLPRRRMCDECRKAARRATKRRAQAKWRRNVFARAPL